MGRSQFLPARRGFGDVSRDSGGAPEGATKPQALGEGMSTSDITLGDFIDANTPDLPPDAGGSLAGSYGGGTSPGKPSVFDPNVDGTINVLGDSLGSSKKSSSGGGSRESAKSGGGGGGASVSGGGGGSFTFGNGTGKSPSPIAVIPPKQAPTKAPMSTGTKVAIGLGALALVATVAVVATRKKKAA